MSIWDQMRKLEKGWDSYNADPPSEQAIENARAFSELLTHWKSIAPSVEGGVGITVGQFYIEFHNDGEIIGIKTENMVDLEFECPDDLYARCEQRAKAEGVPINEWIRQTIRAYIESAR